MKLPRYQLRYIAVLAIICITLLGGCVAALPLMMLSVPSVLAVAKLVQLSTETQLKSIKSVAERLISQLTSTGVEIEVR